MRESKFSSEPLHNPLLPPSRFDILDARGDLSLYEIDRILTGQSSLDEQILSQPSEPEEEGFASVQPAAPLIPVVYGPLTPQERAEKLQSDYGFGRRTESRSFSNQFHK